MRTSSVHSSPILFGSIFKFNIHPQPASLEAAEQLFREHAGVFTDEMDRIETNRENEEATANMVVYPDGLDAYGFTGEDADGLTGTGDTEDGIEDLGWMEAQLSLLEEEVLQDLPDATRAEYQQINTHAEGEAVLGQPTYDRLRNGFKALFQEYLQARKDAGVQVEELPILLDPRMTTTPTSQRLQ